MALLTETCGFDDGALALELVKFRLPEESIERLTTLTRDNDSSGTIYAMALTGLQIRPSIGSYDGKAFVLSPSDR